MTETQKRLAEQLLAGIGNGKQLVHSWFRIDKTDATVDLALVSAKGDLEIGIGFEDRLQVDFQLGLADAYRLNLKVVFGIVDEAHCFQSREHLVFEHRLQFVGRSGKHDQGFAVILPPDAWSGTSIVANRFGGFWPIGLLSVIFADGSSEPGEAFFDGLHGDWIEDESFAEEVCDGLLGAIVHGWPEAPGGDERIGPFPTELELLQNILVLIGDRVAAVEGHATLSQSIANVGQMAVSGQS